MDSLNREAVRHWCIPVIGRGERVSEDKGHQFGREHCSDGSSGLWRVGGRRGIMRAGEEGRAGGHGAAWANMSAIVLVSSWEEEASESRRPRRM